MLSFKPLPSDGLDDGESSATSGEDRGTGDLRADCPRLYLAGDRPGAGNTDERFTDWKKSAGAGPFPSQENVDEYNVRASWKKSERTFVNRHHIGAERILAFVLIKSVQFGGRLLRRGEEPVHLLHSIFVAFSLLQSYTRSSAHINVSPLEPMRNTMNLRKPTFPASPEPSNRDRGASPPHVPF